MNGSFAILEDRQTRKIYTVPKKLLPNSAKPSNILNFIDNQFVFNELETNKARKEIQNLLSNLKK